MQGQRLCSTIGQGRWLGSLPRQVIECAAGHLWPCFLVGQNRKLCLAVGWDCKPVPLPRCAIGCAPWQYNPLAGDLNQAELPIEIPGEVGPWGQLCLWTKLLAGISAQVLWQMGTQSTEIWAMVTVSPTPFSISIWFPQFLSSLGFPSDAHEGRPEWTSQGAYLNRWRSDVHLGFSFLPTGETAGPGKPSVLGIVLTWGEVDAVSEVTPLILLKGILCLCCQGCTLTSLLEF